MNCVIPFRRAKFLAVVLTLLFASKQLAQADPINESIDASKLGVTPNFACGGQGACGAVASINSFSYLGRQFPGIYGNPPNNITPNYNATSNTDTVDAQAFGFDGWQVGANPMRRGYYDPLRPHNADYTDSFLQTKKDWINDHAPGTTVFSSWFTGSADNNRKPTILDLAAEMKKKEDVEFFVQADGFYHVMTLAGVMCDMAMNCSIKYQDPNDPAQANPNETMAKIYTANISVMDGMLQFTGVPGSGFAGTVTITAAFSESPVPEPATAVLMITAAFGLLLCGRRPVR